LPNAYKIKQINNKANHLLEFEYTLLGSCTCTLCTCDITAICTI